MRNIGEMRRPVSLWKRAVDTTTGSSVESYELLLQTRAARRDMSGREFALAGGTHAESRLIFTIRKPAAVTLDSGVTLIDAGVRYEVVEVVQNPVWRGMLDLRATSTRMEGMGYV